MGSGSSIQRLRLCLRLGYKVVLLLSLEDTETRPERGLCLGAVALPEFLLVYEPLPCWMHPCLESPALAA